jgi:hypothetical protein
MRIEKMLLSYKLLVGYDPSQEFLSFTKLLGDELEGERHHPPVYTPKTWEFTLE